MSFSRSSARARQAGTALALALVATALTRSALAQTAGPAPADEPPAIAEPRPQDELTEPTPDSAPSPPGEPRAALPSRSLAEPRVIYVKSPPGTSPPLLENNAVTLGGSPKWSLNLALVHTSLSGGDFDDGSVLTRRTRDGGAEGVLLPELGSGTGFVFGLAYGWEDSRVGSVSFSAGVSYSATWLSPHSTHAEDLTGVAHEIESPVRLALRVTRQLRPYLQVSGAIAILSLSGVHLTQSGFDSTSITLSGTSLGVGSGLLVRIVEGVEVDAFLGYRRFSITNVGDAPPRSTLNTEGWTLRLGPTLVL